MLRRNQPKFFDSEPAAAAQNDVEKPIDNDIPSKDASQIA